MSKVISIFTRKPLSDKPEKVINPIAGTFFEEQQEHIGDLHLLGFEVQRVSEFVSNLVIEIRKKGSYAIRMEYGDSADLVAENLRRMADVLDKL